MSQFAPECTTGQTPDFTALYMPQEKLLPFKIITFEIAKMEKGE